MEDMHPDKDFEALARELRLVAAGLLAGAVIAAIIAAIVGAL